MEEKIWNMESQSKKQMMVVLLLLEEQSHKGKALMIIG